MYFFSLEALKSTLNFSVVNLGSSNGLKYGMCLHKSSATAEDADEDISFG